MRGSILVLGLLSGLQSRRENRAITANEREHAAENNLP